jgi:hypothetical protein
MAWLSRHLPLSGGAKDWRLLSQLDSDESAAAAGRFDNAWAILQCH